MTSTVASATHAGRRKYNQDTIITRTVEAADGPVRLLAVLDGMGGMRAGDRASQLAAEVLVAAIEQRLQGRSADERLVREALSEAVAQAHEAVLQEGLTEPEKRGMGTTLVAALERAGRFIAVNVGDSRAYLYAPGANGMRRLTRDHSLREEAVRLGKLTAEQAKNSPYAHALTRAVGSGPRPTPDLFPEPTGWFELPAGGVLLMCSDGMSGALDDGQIGELIGGAPDAPAVVQRLLRAAYHGGSNDNISVLALADQGFRATKPLPPPPPIEASPADDPTLARVSAADLSVSPPSFSRMLTKALLLGLGLVLAFLLFVFFRPLPRPGRAPAPPPVPANDGAPAAAPADGGLTVELTPGPGEL